MSELDPLLGPVLAAICAVFATVAGGIGISRRLSDAKRERAHDAAETSLFETALQATTRERDGWRRAAEEARERCRKCEKRLAVIDARSRLQATQIHIMRKRFAGDPDAAAFLSSDLSPLLGDDPSTDPQALRTDPRIPRSPKGKP